MEDTLRVKNRNNFGSLNERSLNPCFNGRYSQRNPNVFLQIEDVGLNPCFNGRYSQRYFKQYLLRLVAAVLILVLMEDTLRGSRSSL